MFHILRIYQIDMSIPKKASLQHRAFSTYKISANPPTHRHESENHPKAREDVPSNVSPGGSHLRKKAPKCKHLSETTYFYSKWMFIKLVNFQGNIR